MIWDWEYALSSLPIILGAAIITIQAAGLSFAFALILGLVFAVLRRSQIWFVRFPIIAIVEFVRSTPVLVQLYALYFGLPVIGLSLSPFWTGVATLSLHASTYISEVFRAGLDAVPMGQLEAWRALNYRPWHAMRHVVLPQAVPPIIPGLGNYLILMLKDTPLLSAIAVLEMLQVAKTLGSQTFRYLEPLTLVGLIFILLSLFAAQLVRVVETRARRIVE